LSRSKARVSESIESQEPVLETRHLTKQFPTPQGRFLTACADISLLVYPGQTLGIVGESGCGKSTFVRMLTQLDPPTAGEIRFHGENILAYQGETLRQNRRHIQMVFQDPLASFHPKMRVGDILTEPLLNFGLLSKSEKQAKARALLRLVELPEDFACRYPHNLSGGQRQRIGIARALAVEPEVLVCDEATSALDVSIQDTIVALLVRLQREKGISMVFICHDLALIQSFAHQIAVMYLGHIVEVLPGSQVTQAAHPYTQALLAAQFSVHRDPTQPIVRIQGEAPSPLDLPIGCPFQGRCPHCMDQCRQEPPPFVALAPGHQVACYWAQMQQKIG